MAGHNNNMIGFLALQSLLSAAVAFHTLQQQPTTGSSCTRCTRVGLKNIDHVPGPSTRQHMSLYMAGSSDNNQDKKEASSDKDKDKDDQDFYAFLQRISQLPLVNGKVDNNNVLGQSSDPSLQRPPLSSSSSSSRNPFLSPFFGLLNFDDLLGAAASSNNNNNNDQPSAKLQQPSTTTTTTSTTTASEGLLSWGGFVKTLQQTIGDPFRNETVVPVVQTKQQPPPSTPSSFLSSASLATDDFVREATSRVESVLMAASTAVVAADTFSFTTIIQQARNVLKFQDDLVAAAMAAAKDRGLDAFEAAERARNTTYYVASLVAVADQVLRSGYVSKEESYAAIAGNRKGPDQQQARKLLLQTDNNLPKSSSSSSSSSNNPLFENIASAKAISYQEFGPAISTIAEMGWISGGIYENKLQRLHELEHSIVAQGITADVFWMITDSVENEADYYFDTTIKNAKDIPVRTFVIRGFDASDERVDREEMFTEICNLQSEIFDSNLPGLLVHRGLHGLAKAVYKDIQKYIDWSAPAQKIIFTGHSVGGSISILLTMMLARDRGADFVRQKVLRVFTFGCPPALRLDTNNVEPKRNNNKSQRCQILELYGLPASMVYGIVQPWDPIVRLFSPIDGLYPLVDDIGEDGMTLYSSGPPRSLRLVTRALVEAWEGWPRYRDMIRAAGPQRYQPVGLQHIMLPEPVRYLTDRFVNVNVNVPPLDEIVRVAPDELYQALDTLFPLDVFELSYVTSAIRGFLHHFYPAYDAPLVDYAQKVSKQSKVQTKQEALVQNIEASTMEESPGRTKNGEKTKGPRP